jgi:hypothetical protein
MRASRSLVTKNSSILVMDLRMSWASLLVLMSDLHIIVGGGSAQLVPQVLIGAKVGA